MESIEYNWHLPESQALIEELELNQLGNNAILATFRSILEFLQTEAITHVVEPMCIDPDPEDHIICIEVSVGIIIISGVGSKIRFTYSIGECDLLKFDAYAHHSEAILATLKTWISIYQSREDKAH